MKKLAIISSHDELCGNATYTEALRNGFSDYFEVHVFPLQFNLLNKSHHHFTKLANAHIEDIASQLKNYDYVNIQFEPGLLGFYPKRILTHFKKLAEASKNLVVTMHRFDSKSAIFEKHLLRDLAFLRFKKFFKEISKKIRHNYYTDLHANIISICKKQNAAIMVHLPRDKFLIQNLFDYKRVYDHPITFLKKNEREILQSKASNIKSKFIHKYGLTPSDIVIGIFGFIAKYKDYGTLIKAIKYLPDHYKLFIFGSQHPDSIVRDEEVNDFISEIIHLIEREPSSKRIHFFGSLSNDAFIENLLCCDITVLPYLETNQSGSGIASLTLEVGSKAIFSQNLAFIELEKYAPGCFKTFSIGNHLELADCINIYNEAPTSALEQYRNTYNIDTNVALYKRAFEEFEIQK